MEYLSATTQSKWANTSVNPNSPAPDNQQVEEQKRALERAFTDVLVSENLIVLTGLGTSLCLKDGNGTRLAPTMSALWEAVKTKTRGKFDAVQKQVKYKKPTDGDNIELLLSHCQLLQSLEPSDGLQKFISDAEGAIVSSCRFVKSDTDLSIHKTFLRKLARRSSRKPRMKLFTTNYDLCFETAASQSRFIVIDGFSHSQPQEFDGSYFGFDFVRRDIEREIPDYIPNVFQLHKMHGSLDWVIENGKILKAEEPPNPVIIYPQIRKFQLSYEQPFLEMMSRFQASLRQPNSGLLVIGFGMNDAHITQPLMSAIESNIGLKVVVVDPLLKASTNNAVAELKSLIEKGDWRLTLVNGTFEEVTTLIPDLVAQSEQETYRQRVVAAGTRQ